MQITTIDPVEAIDTPLVETKKDLAMHKAGASREASYKAMAEGLKARRVSVQKDGSTVDEPDHMTRLKAAEMIARVNGDMKQSEVTVDNRKVNITGVPSEMVTSLLAMVSDVKAQIEGLRSSGRQTGDIIDTVATEVGIG